MPIRDKTVGSELIMNLSNIKKPILRYYIDAKLNPHRQPRIEEPHDTKSFVSELFVDYEQMIDDIAFVQRGAMTPGEYVMKF